MTKNETKNPSVHTMMQEGFWQFRKKQLSRNKNMAFTAV